MTDWAFAGLLLVTLFFAAVWATQSCLEDGWYPRGEQNSIKLTSSRSVSQRGSRRNTGCDRSQLSPTCRRPWKAAEHADNHAARCWPGLHNAKRSTVLNLPSGDRSLAIRIRGRGSTWQLCILYTRRARHKRAELNMRSHHLIDLADMTQMRRRWRETMFFVFERTTSSGNASILRC